MTGRDNRAPGQPPDVPGQIPQHLRHAMGMGMAVNHDPAEAPAAIAAAAAGSAIDPVAPDARTAQAARRERRHGHRTRPVLD